MNTLPLALGDRVLVFDPQFYKDDRTTPPAGTFQPATVKCHYKHKSRYDGKYESLIDVVFDHDGRLSRGHFTWGVKRLKGTST